MVDSGYERISNTLSVYSGKKISNIALTFNGSVFKNWHVIFNGCVIVNWFGLMNSGNVALKREKEFLVMLLVMALLLKLNITLL